MPSPRTAVVLAAGEGLRLRGVGDDRPKGFLVVGGETLIERSVRALRERGLARVVIVAGYRAETYRSFARPLRGSVQIVENGRFAETGSMASLDVALGEVAEDFLLLESDLFYDPAALDAILAHRGRDALLASAPTGAGDEVWVEAPGGRVTGLSKERGSLRRIDGEFVGISRVSRELGGLLRGLYRRFTEEHGHGRMAYDTDALHAAASRHPISLLVLPRLLWGEIDTEAHLRRVRERVFPDWAAGCARRSRRSTRRRAR